MGGCAGKSDDRMEKDKWLKENPKFLSHTAKVLRIRNGISLDYVKEKKQEVEKNTSCSISVAKKEDEEPSYHKSWTCNSRSIVIAEGNVENSVTDIIVCPIDEHCQPAGESAEHIFQKGKYTGMRKEWKYVENQFMEINVFIEKSTHTSWFRANTTVTVTKWSSTALFKTTIETNNFENQ